MKRNRPPSEQTTLVLLALAEDPAAWRYGYDLCQQTGLKAGSMYPILMRLTDRGLLETSWESDIPVGRPPRHLYRLTGQGLELAAELEKAIDSAAKAKRARLRPRTEGA
jgi:DNA-binding PadR family transcriptional regulator